MIQHTAILQGDYLAGTRVLVTLDRNGRITACNAISCLWSGSARFDGWFRDQYNPVVLVDAGEEYYAWLDAMSRDDDEPEQLTPIAA